MQDNYISILEVARRYGIYGKRIYHIYSSLCNKYGGHDTYAES